MQVRAGGVATGGGARPERRGMYMRRRNATQRERHAPTKTYKMAAATRAPRGRLRPSHRANDRWTRTYSEVARHDLSTNSTTTKLGCRTIPYFSLAALSCRAVSACRSCTIKVRRIDVVRYATLRAASYRTVRYLSDARSAGLYSRSMYSCVVCVS